MKGEKEALLSYGYEERIGIIYMYSKNKDLSILVIKKGLIIGSNFVIPDYIESA